MIEFVTVVGRLSGLLWNGQLRSVFIRRVVGIVWGTVRSGTYKHTLNQLEEESLNLCVILLTPGCLTASQINETRRRA